MQLLSVHFGVFCVSVGTDIVMLFKLSQVAKLNMCSLKIAHHGAAERSRVKPPGKVRGLKIGS